MTSMLPNQQTSTKRISDEVFEAVDKEIAAQAKLEAAKTVVVVPAAVPTRIERLSATLLPYVWAVAIGTWATGLMIMFTLTPEVQCIGAGVAIAGVLGAVSYIWRSFAGDHAVTNPA